MLRLAKKIEAHNGAVKLKTVASKSRLSRDRDGSDNESVSRAGGAKPRRAVLEKLNLYDDKDGPEKAVDQVRVLIFILSSFTFSRISRDNFSQSAASRAKVVAVILKMHSSWKRRRAV